MAKQVSIRDLYNRNITVCNEWKDSIKCFNAFGKKVVISVKELVGLKNITDAEKLWVVIHPDVIDETDLNCIVETFRKKYAVPVGHQKTLQRYINGNEYGAIIYTICKFNNGAEKVIMRLVRDYIDGHSDF